MHTQIQCINIALCCFILRLERNVKEDTTLMGIKLKAGLQVGMSVMSLHLDPEVWPEPNKFDPDRFDSNNS